MSDLKLKKLKTLAPMKPKLWKTPLFPILSHSPGRFAVLAVDMSLRSPGFAVVSKRSAESRMNWKFFAFGKKPAKTTFTCGTSVELLSEKPMSEGNDLDRYANVVQPFIKHGVKPLLEDEGFGPEEIQVAVESYAFPKRAQAGSNYKLHEICGILKYHLHSHLGIKHIDNVSPATWRSRVMLPGIDFHTPPSLEKPDVDREPISQKNKNVSRKRKQRPTQAQRTQFRHDAKKSSFQCFSNHFPAVDLLSCCNRKLGKDGNVPTPVQDIADAFCIALSVVRGYPEHQLRLPYPLSVVAPASSRRLPDCDFAKFSTEPAPKKRKTETKLF